MTGTSVVAIKYKDGILMAADMGGLFHTPPITSTITMILLVPVDNSFNAHLLLSSVLTRF